MLYVASLLLRIAFFAILGKVILVHVLTAKRISVNEVYAALCFYLLIGIIWTFLFMILQTVQEDAFLLQGKPIVASIRHCWSEME